MDAHVSRLVTREEQGVTVVHFADTKVIDQRNINEIGAELMEMVESKGVRKMLINMENVHYLSSAVLGKLISVHKALRMDGGVLKLSNIAPPIYEVFEITRLNRVFDIFETEAEALEAFDAEG
jgi:anti-sigma B factor antagonist